MRTRNIDRDKARNKHVVCALCGFRVFTTKFQGKLKTHIGIGKTDTAQTGFITQYHPEVIGSIDYNEDKIYDDRFEYNDEMNRTIYDPIHTGGCPKCNSYLYNKED